LNPIFVISFLLFLELLIIVYDPIIDLEFTF